MPRHRYDWAAIREELFPFEETAATVEAVARSNATAKMRREEKEARKLLQLQLGQERALMAAANRLAIARQKELAAIERLQPRPGN